MRSDKEYELAKAIATYLKLQYPNVPYRFDMAGLNLSKAQAGKNKVIQCGKGWPDLFIAALKLNDRRDKKNHVLYLGLFLELKAEVTKIWQQNGRLASAHIEEQNQVLKKLILAGYKASFAVGFDEAKKLIDDYLK